MRARVLVRPKAGILDPQGQAVERALPALGFDDVGHVRAGRSFDFDVEASDEASARARAAELADRLLANPVIEQWELALTASGTGP